MQRSRQGYHWEATTLEGFIQQLAVGYVARRYFFYIAGRVARRLGVDEHDRRMLDKFDVARSKWSRYRRGRRVGPDGRPLANVQYLRFREFWVLLATAGHHRFYQEHSGPNGERHYRDVREHPVVYGGYSVSHRGGKASVRLHRKAYQQLKWHYLGLALSTRGTGLLEEEFQHAPFEPYGGVTRQMFAILRAVNDARKRAGLPLVSKACVRVRRRSVRPFAKNVSQLAA